MAFEAKNFIICSRFPLFRASGNLWLYKTLDTLDSILESVDSDGYSTYFRPRENLKNHDSPNEGDVILMFVEDAKLVYLKVVGKAEKPYRIKVARTYLENESTLLALITELQLDKATKATDFVTAITDENLGITQTEQTELEEKIDLAANSGRMITAQGFWYAKMHSETVAPSAEDGTNYADFSQVDGEGNPIIVTYNRVSGAWVQDQTITPPADYDGYVPITSKIWDISEQDGQQGGRVLWNHSSKQFTPYPTIVSFDSIEITGDSTVEMPLTPDDDNIANVGYVKNTIGGARNVGDIFFTARKDSALNGAVECNGSTYQTTDFSGAASIGQLLALNKIPYVSLATYQTLLNTQGSCGVFGWDGVGTTAFRVPSLEDIFIETGTAAQVGDYLAPGAPNITGSISIPSYNTGEASVSSTGCMQSTQTGSNVRAIGYADQGYPPMVTTLDASRSSSVYSNSVNTIQPNAVRYRAMVQLAVSATDEAVETCTSVLADVAGLKDLSNITNAGKAESVSWGRNFTALNTTVASSGGSGIAGTYQLGFTDNKVKLGLFFVDSNCTQSGGSTVALATDVATYPCVVCGTNNSFTMRGCVMLPFINEITISFPEIGGGIGHTALYFRGWM